jgi:hypothetical protein
VYYADGMSEDYEPNLFTKAFAALTLGLYIGVPQIAGLLLLASFWSAWARVAFGLLIATCFLPLRPLFWRRAANSYVFLAWRRYFKFSFVFDQSLNAYKDYVIAQFPHGAFPLGSLLGGTFMATEYPEYTCYALAANSSFLVPVWRHVHTWLGTLAATEKNFRRLLALGTCEGLRAAGALPPASDGGAGGSGASSEAGDSPRASRGGGAAASQGLVEAAAALRASTAGGGAPSAGGASEGGAARKSRLRKRNPQGVSVGVMVGGIAEM